jgi:hypothetical protein
MAEVVSQTPDGTVKNMVGATSPTLSLGEMMAQRTAALKPYKEEVEAKAKKASEFEAEKGMFEQQQKMRQAGEKYAALTAAQQKAEAAYEPVESLEQDMLNATFVPTQESAKDLAALYGLIGVVGWAIGSGGKGNAMRAMSAQNGMLEGYQKGRADLYKKEKDLFETNIKALREKAKVVSEKARRVAELAAKDPQAAAELSTYISAQEGAEFYKINAEKFGYAKAAKDAEETYKAADKIYAEIVKEHLRAAQRTGKPIPMTGSDGNTYQLFPDGSVKKAETPEGVKLTRPTVEKVPKVSTGKPAKEKATQTSALLAGRAENIREAFVQAATDIVNITKFPPNTMLGIFSGLTGASADGMVSGIRNAIARGVTDKEQRMLEALLSGIEGNMAFALGGGYATSQSKARMEQYKSQIARSGDDPAQVPLMLARFRQEMNILADNFPSKPGATPEMSSAVQKANDLINKAVPFTVDDVLNAELGERKSSSPTPKPKGSGTKEDPIKLD